MKRPEVTLTNFEQVYDYYELHVQSQAYARFAHFTLSKVYRPVISTDDGAGEAIRDAISEGNRLVVSPNHLTADDQYVVVAVAQKMKEFHPLRGNAFIPTEPSLFTRKGVQGKLLRRAVDGLGAVPTFRLEDLRRQGIEETDEIRQMHKNSIQEASEVHVSKLIQGNHMAGFWEGTRNRVDFTKVQELKKGIGHTAIAASEHVKVMLLPMGLYYGGEPEDYKKPVVPNKYTPTVHVGMPIELKSKDVDEVVRELRPAIQKCIDVAVANTP